MNGGECGQCDGDGGDVVAGWRYRDEPLGGRLAVWMPLCESCACEFAETASEDGIEILWK